MAKKSGQVGPGWVRTQQVLRLLLLLRVLSRVRPGLTAPAWPGEPGLVRSEICSADSRLERQRGRDIEHQPSDLQFSQEAWLSLPSVSHIRHPALVDLSAQISFENRTNCRNAVRNMQ